MRKTWIILAVLLAFALVGTVSAFQSITFPFNGQLKVGYLGSVTASYNDGFGIEFGVGPTSLGFTKSPYTAPGTIFFPGKCEDGVPVVLYITNPNGVSFYSDRIGVDGVNHADVSESEGVHTVWFEDLLKSDRWYDNDMNDVGMNITCIRDPVPTPEFPTMALPAALIVGMLGAVLFIQKSKEN